MQNCGKLIVIIGVLFFFSSCSDHKKEVIFQKAIQNIQSGTLIQKMEEGNVGVAPPVLNPPKSDHEILLDVNPEKIIMEAEIPFNADVHPCAQIPVFEKPSDLSPENQKKVITVFGKCITVFSRVIHAYEISINYFKKFQYSQGPSWSALSLDEMFTIITQKGFGALLIQMMAPDAQKELRTVYSDLELDEIKKLRDTRKEKIEEVLGTFSMILNEHAGLKQLLQESNNNRYQLFLAYLEAHDHPEFNRSEFILTKLKEVLPLDNLLSFVTYLNNVRPGHLAEVENLFYPYGFLAALPDEGMENKPLDFNFENPVRHVISEMEKHLAGSEEYVQTSIENYQQLRDITAKPFEAPEKEISSEAAKVVVIDTGLDFFKYPELGLFLSDNSPGRVKSYDYADRKQNIFIPAVAGLSHGSGTAGTVLTLVSALNVDVLKNKKFDLGFWKVWSNNSLLAGWPEYTHPSWDPVELPVIEAILDSIHNPDKEQQPDIVSFSLVFVLGPILELLEDKDFLKKAPWLWVMAAGNEGTNIHPIVADKEGHLQLPEIPYGCMMDVPEANRPQDQILCVGALKRPEKQMTEEAIAAKAGKFDPHYMEDRVATYSNHGDFVDVYTYESFISLCPNGTSCSTPAITAVATTLKAEFPLLTPQQIKKIIINSATLKEVHVENPEGALPEEKRLIRVFDPEKDILKARQMATAMMIF